ncbi:repair protein Rad1/Rec1/Rad17-domain-containing protein [Tuber borchii]|uniref:Repair protein Rad1/Rec1/Rad17-domain-containing protein n=1 Tax=Tuber borchii TaxID=42251 RepID=A0A2T6ZAB8_TUBBO|nr:repair protein Rad1/Rec1/Rad17-domain-containing protein [Tuber borchii]
MLAPPLFTALTTSSRQILTLLKCIDFQSKAQLQIPADSLQLVHYLYLQSPPHLTQNLEEDEDPVIQFGISLMALLECLQIFGGGDAGGGGGKWRGGGGRAGGGGAEGWSGGTAGVTAFDHTLLRIAGTCRFLYEERGPSCLILEEPPTTTICELTTHTPTPHPDIPLSPTLTQKIILKSSLLPPPFWDTTTVEFTNDGELLETFIVSRRAKGVYYFDLIRHAGGAMAAATKVSARND